MDCICGVEEFYDATAQEWAEAWYDNDTMLPLLQTFLSFFQRRPRILDAGCGAGYESMRLAKLGAEVVGVDFSEKSIRIARSRNPSLRFERMDCMELDTALGFFDGIAAIALLVHIEDSQLQLIFHNFRNVMKEQGFLFIAFAGGEGYQKEKSLVTIGNVKYDRRFYLHQPERIIEIAKSFGFAFFQELFLPKGGGRWKYFVFQAE